MIVDDVVVQGSTLRECAYQITKKKGEIVSVGLIANLADDFYITNPPRIIRPKALLSKYDLNIKVQPIEECDQCKEGQPLTHDMGKVQKLVHYGF
jgi:orotate phosphoribosyltransferase